jgi:hypothetical protein
VAVRADFNHDGADDLAIGAPFESVGSLFAAGAVHVLDGSAGGLTGTGSQVLTQDSPGVPDTAGSGDTFGVALASGDFDNDGFADLAVGVELEDVDGADDVGGVNVLHGSAGGPDRFRQPVLPPGGWGRGGERPLRARAHLRRLQP